MKKFKLKDKVKVIGPTIYGGIEYQGQSGSIGTVLNNNEYFVEMDAFPNPWLSGDIFEASSLMLEAVVFKPSIDPSLCPLCGEELVDISIGVKTLVCKRKGCKYERRG